MDVWRTNKELQAYYERQGFTSCGVCTDPDYPSGALFQKPTEHLRQPWPPLFHEERAGSRDPRDGRGVSQARPAGSFG